MTHVTEQTSSELRAHMRRLKSMAGWHEPLADRLYKEIVEQDKELERLRASWHEQDEHGREAFARYLKECEECAIVPDVAGAFHWAWMQPKP